MKQCDGQLNIFEFLGDPKYNSRIKREETIRLSLEKKARRKKNQRRYYQRHREPIRKQQHEYHVSNGEYIRERKRELYQQSKLSIITEDNNKYIYMAVTPDQYETPIAEADTPYKLSELIGGHPTGKQIQDLIYKNRSGRNHKMKFIRVKV